MKNQAFRHGEIAFIKINSLPEGLNKSNQKEFLKGSHGNPHTFDNGELYLKNVDDNIFGYFVAKDTKLKHPEHGEGKGKTKEASLPNGVYELRRQTEWINSEMKQIID